MKASNYVLGPTLGSGRYSKVFSATHKQDGRKKYAIKVIDQERLSNKDLKHLENEIKLLQSLNHPHIVKYYGSYGTDDGKFCLVMEECSGGGLFERIVAKEKYSEADAQQLLRCLAEALKYCHGKGVVHRDLKPENILLFSASSDSDIKLADFGFAKEIEKTNGLTTQLGTPNYMAPEILKKEVYSAPVDMWAFGVIAYILLCGYPPFYGRSDSELFTRIKSGNFSFEPEHWDKISDKAKDMIRQLLRLDPARRLTAEGVLQHPWMNEDRAASDISPALTELRSTLMKRKFRGGVDAVIAVNKLKHLAKASSDNHHKLDAAGPPKTKNITRRKPKPTHPLDLDLFRVALLPLVGSVALAYSMYELSPRGTLGEGMARPFDVAYGSLILLYLATLHISRCMTLGLHYLGEILWGCNIALLFSGVGIATNKPFMVGTAVCVVAVDQISWYIDVIGYAFMQKFPVGVAKYMAAPSTTWVHFVTGTHHLWFIPLAIIWLGPHGGIPPGSYWGSVLTTAVIATLARLLTPFSIYEGPSGKEVRVWNINLAYEFYDDIAIPPLHILDHRPAYIYLPFLISVCNFILNVIPCALVIAISRVPFGGAPYGPSDWHLPFRP